MNGIWYYIIAFFIVWTIAFLFKNKLVNQGVDVDFPIIMWKTKRLMGVINRLARLSPRFWKWYMSIGIIIGYIAMVFITYSLISSLFTIFETPSVSIVLPGVEVPGSPFYIPLGYGLIALVTVLVVHEFSHGIISIVEKINIKSIGLLLFVVLPGAFVEPDEEQLISAKKLTKLRIYVAGSLANITLATFAIIVIILISSFVIPSTFNENGIEITKVIEDSPADGVLKEGMIIYSINNHKIVNFEDYANIVFYFKPNKNVSIETNQGNYVLKLDKNPKNSSKGFVGIQSNKHYEIKQEVSNIYGNQIPWIIFEISNLFTWIFVLNLGIGLFNILPLKPLDGGYMFEILLSYKLSEKYYKPIVNIVAVILVLIIVFSLSYSFISAI